MNQKGNSIKIWDSFIRLFHGLLIILLGGLWWTVENGRMELHKDIGIALFALLIVRIGWGIFGSENARFKQFLKSPAAIPGHLRKLLKGDYEPENTHSTAGGWSVIVMLGLLLSQVVTGLFSTDGILFSGPLSSLLSSDGQDAVTSWHKTQFDVILIVISVHILAVLFYRVKGTPLTASMIHGYRITHQQAPNLKPGWQGFILAIAVWLILMLLLD
ncbi:cytochrome b/b6 domain-containing protein [Idiomarina sp. HP20-50]|uniref:cytochrome b/b6 domain-containing protein n=1 Tax=Idiomarina sp. HP20-50 TaxID=3070813 RepID=UPI00294ADC60|nr:cytochrome b/b6 domain-containing protein [Idiomarina sp. HP20-50]MDV6317094.1 cytochrome b/b6 domain-containing protein [Idiomarina sp. HP20-50]